MASRTCSCPGDSYYDKWKSWRVINRGKCSRLYCLVCRATWLTRARYADIMRDHKVERRSGMTDDDVLRRINDGSLLVDCDQATVVSVTKRGRFDLRVIERESNGSKYRFVEVAHNGKKKKVALHRLVWMAAHRKIPPDGYDVDHINGPADVIGNLRLRESSENRSNTRRWNNEPAADTADTADTPF